MKTRSILAALMVAALLIPACTKHRIPATHEHGGNQNSGGQNSGGNQPGHGGEQGGNGGEQSGLTLNLRTDWSIVYEGRWEDYVEEDGSLSDVEKFTVSCPGAVYFEVRILGKDELANNFNGSLKAYLEDEEGWIAKDAEAAGRSFSELDYIYTQSTNTILFDRSRSGEYNYILIGITKDGKVSGDYTQTTVVIEQEAASGEYKKWLGEWLVSNGEVGYRISVSQSEANWLYRVDGWETGSSIAPAPTGTVMDQEYIEARFDRNSGNMVFFSQYLGGYEDDEWGWLDEYFLGNILDSGGFQGITDTGLDVGVASFEAESTVVANLTGAPLKMYVDGMAFDTKFYSMCYWNVDSQNKEPEWCRYNLNTPAFPLSMTKTKASGLVDIAPEREVNSRTIHVNQPRDHRVAVQNTGVCSEGGRR